jgi:hypothetical protein
MDVRWALDGVSAEWETLTMMLDPVGGEGAGRFETSLRTSAGTPRLRNAQPRIVVGTDVVSAMLYVLSIFVDMCDAM